MRDLFGTCVICLAHWGGGLGVGPKLNSHSKLYSLAKTDSCYSLIDILEHILSYDNKLISAAQISMYMYQTAGRN